MIHGLEIKAHEIVSHQIVKPDMSSGFDPVRESICKLLPKTIQESKAPKDF